MKSRRAISVLSVAIACLIGIWGCAGAAAQQAAFKKIREKGGRIDLRGNGPQITFSYAKIVDDDLACLEGLTHIHELKIEGDEITDAGLVHLEKVGQIDEIELLKTKITAEGIKQLKMKFPNSRITKR